MAEQIDIASLNFDTDKLSQSLIKTRTEIDSIKNSLTELRKENRNTVKSIDELEKEQQELAKAGKENSKQYQENAKELKNLQSVQNNTTKTIVDQEGKLRILNKEQRELNKVLDSNRKGQVDSTAVMEKANAVLQQQWTTQNEANAAGKAMMALRKDLNPSIAEEAALMEKLSQRVDEANEFQEQFNTQNEQRVKGIGKYKQAITDAIKETTSFGSATGKAGKGASGLASGISSGIPGLKGLTGAAQGFSAVPLVAIVGLLVQGFKFLVDQFKSTQGGMDAITSVTRPLSAVMEALKGILQEVGTFFVKAFTEPRKVIEELTAYVRDKVMKQFNAFAKIIQAVGERDWDKFKEGFSDLGDVVTEVFDDVASVGGEIRDRFSDAYEAGKRIDELQKDIEDRENAFILLNQELTTEMRRQEEIARDTSRTLEEREAAVKEQTRLAEQLVGEEQKIRDLKIEQLQIQQEFNDTSREDEAELNRLIAERNASENLLIQTKKRNLGVERQIRNEVARAAEEERKKRVAAVLERRKISLETYELENANRAQNAQEEIEFAQEVSRRKREILQEEFDNKLMSKERYDLSVKQMDMELAQEEAEIRLFYATQTLNQEILALQQQQEERKRLTVDGFLDETLELQALAEERDRLAKERLDAGLINRHEYNDLILESEQELNERTKELNDEWETQQREDRDLARMLENEQILIDLQDHWDLRREIERQSYEAAKEDLERQREDGLISEENYLKAIEILNQNHAKAMMTIDEEVHNNKLSLATNALSQLSSIAGEQSALGKAFAIAAATIDTYQSAVSAFNAMSGIPIVGPALGAVAAAAAIETGLKTVSKIKSTRAQKYTGGYTGDGGMFTKTGNTHAGEVVWNQQDVMRAGGVNAVEAMRPTSETFGSMPTGVPQEKDDSAMWEVVGNIIGERVEQGAERGTDSGMVSAGENEFVRLKATF